MNSSTSGTTPHFYGSNAFSSFANDFFSEAASTFDTDFIKECSYLASDTAMATHIKPIQTKELLQAIQSASTLSELKEIYHDRKSELSLFSLQNAYIERQHYLEDQLTSEMRALKARVTTFTDSNGELIGELDLENRIRERCPKNTYESITVTTIDSYQFPNGLKKAREIKLIRSEWGIIKLPILNSIEALFSSAIISDSIYRETLGHQQIMCGLLASSLVVGDKANGRKPDMANQAAFEKQIRAAYWSGKRIEIVFPVDLSESGSCKIIDESAIIAFSINAGKFLRSLFTND